MTVLVTGINGPLLLNCIRLVFTTIQGEPIMVDYCSCIGSLTPTMVISNVVPYCGCIGTPADIVIEPHVVPCYDHIGKSPTIRVEPSALLWLYWGSPTIRAQYIVVPYCVYFFYPTL